FRVFCFSTNRYTNVAGNTDRTYNHPLFQQTVEGCCWVCLYINQNKVSTRRHIVQTQSLKTCFKLSHTVFIYFSITRDKVFIFQCSHRSDHGQMIDVKWLTNTVRSEEHTSE